MSLEKEDVSKVDENAVKDALEKLFAKNRVEVWSMHSKCPIYMPMQKPRRKLTRTLGWSWKGKSLDGKKTFVVCFLGPSGWSSWIEEKTGESKWLTIAKAIAASGGYMLLPTSRYGKPPVITVVHAPRSVEEILIEGDLL